MQCSAVKPLPTSAVGRLFQSHPQPSWPAPCEGCEEDWRESPRGPLRDSWGRADKDAGGAYVGNREGRLFGSPRRKPQGFKAKAIGREEEAHGLKAPE